MRHLFIVLLGLLATSSAIVMNIYDSLNITEDDAKKCLVLSIGAGAVMRGEHPDLVADAKMLSVEQRVEGIRQLIKLAREYAATDDFAKEYKKWREKKLNPGSKSKIGVPKLGKMLENKLDNQLNKEENEKKFPAEPVVMIEKRLSDFLSISATVDFDAALNGGQFVKPEYEKKPAEWKMCFRAGKEVVMAAREEAAKWLAELRNQ